ncbi:lycopene cyclase family protein [Psychroflexus aestuariivivens]|uniref:lycopene cyclase family protein n=1 Tax=Psychroflexus aestuariivivens TaxID=1795040 RepID=UPI000FDBD8C9|nr:lycopene cyclase family protein [Psychroflexus aestuariivivens]
MSSTKYNYIIIGAGAAGLHLALAMLDDEFYRDKKILILDKIEKNKNDRTWCFWEKGEGRWDKILTKSWNQGLVVAKNENIQLELNAYRYKMLQSSDFYRMAKSKIEAHKNVVWLTEEVTKTRQLENTVEVYTGEEKYTADYVFDSRIPKSYSLKHPEYLNIAQHFKGWMIETEAAVFDDQRFTMMDFSLKDGNTTSFTYVLPISSKKALVEFTYFTSNLVEPSVYESFMENYISEKLDIEKYKIVDEEQGVIPMTNFPFSNFSSQNMIKIGTAGGWVKASSGYSFKNCEKESQKIIEKLKSKSANLHEAQNPKYKHYDKIFLEVLTKNNDFGEELFYRMYKNNKIETIFKFLDENSSWKEDLEIITNLSSKPFIKALIRHAKSGFKI